MKFDVTLQNAAGFEGPVLEAEVDWFDGRIGERDVYMFERPDDEERRCQQDTDGPDDAESGEGSSTLAARLSRIHDELIAV